MTGNRPRSRDTSYFETLYTANPDPWDFAGSAYEHRKYAATIEMLGGRHFSRGLEIGCSIGVLTKLLANCCDELFSVDIVEHAIAQARTRCADDRHVTFARMQVPETWPAGCFDLIVFSEVLYFLDPADIARTAALADASLTAGGMLLLVSYTEEIEEPCGGDEAAEAFVRGVLPSNVLIKQRKEPSFRIDLLEKKGPPAPL
jgi:predicted TPR repeat methyltransferase